MHAPVSSLDKSRRPSNGVCVLQLRCGLNREARVLDPSLIVKHAPHAASTVAGTRYPRRGNESQPKGHDGDDVRCYSYTSQCVIIYTLRRCDRGDQSGN